MVSGATLRRYTPSISQPVPDVTALKHESQDKTSALQFIADLMTCLMGASVVECEM